ncbi:hypothetical protein A0H81_00538 [Grifola frondosa]|uniref:Uncharacterized protein n=1 Tax=Grifola frondosa TaxID=5627 RepID=A0A1C7MQN2_GRIFR|nr:hypothetical protein A0H81_00538 [Grifola frondosa]
MPPQLNPISQYPYPSATPQQGPHSEEDEEIKAPYDDLIDQYATPYGHSAHKTYAVDPTSLNLAEGRHGRSPSFPLSQKQSYSTDVAVKDAKHIDDFEMDRPELGYPPTTLKEEKPSRNCWTLIPDSIACRLYLLTVLVETAIDLAIEGDIFLRFQEAEEGQDNALSNDMASRKMPVYLSVFAMAHVFQFAMALDAVYARNTLQFISLSIFNAIFLVYAIIQIGEITYAIPASTTGISNIPIHTLVIVIPIVISVAELAYIALGWKIYTEFGWKIFLCLVKFDLFFWVGFSVQFIWLVLNNTHDAEFYLTCAAFPLSIVVLIEGHLAARHENKWMMITFLTGCAGAMVYFMYKLIKVLRFHTTDTFVDVWKTLTTFSVLAIVILIITFIFACLMMRNFGRGLKNQLSKNKDIKLQRGKSQYIHRGPMSTHPNRMSID